MPVQSGKRSRTATPLSIATKMEQEQLESNKENMPKVNAKLHARKDVKKASKRHIADSSSSSNNNSAKSNKTKSKEDAGSGSSRKGKSKSGTNVNNKMKRTHLVVGTLSRSKEALDSLAQHKTEEEIWHDVVPFKRITQDNDFNVATMHKLITWNVAGLRGLLKKDERAIEKLLLKEEPDLLCLQETKLNVGDADANAKLGAVSGYSFVDHPCSTTKGYSGTRTYVKDKTFGGPYRAHTVCGFTFPNGTQQQGILGNTNESANAQSEKNALEHDVEGRVMTTFLTSPLLKSKSAKSNNNDTDVHSKEEVHEEPFYPMLAVINSYVANSGMNLDRLPYRTQMFDEAMRQYLRKINAMCKHNSASHKMIWDGGFIWTGDLNVADKDFDRYYSVNYKNMQECSGFTPEERSSFRTTLAETNSVDIFRELYPRSGPVYTFWSQRINARARNAGWRLDYFVASSSLMPFVVDCFPMCEVQGSDHCPLQLWLKKALWRGKSARLLKTIRK